MTYCKAPFVAFTINYDSSVKPCPHFQQKYPVDLNAGLEQIWRNQSLDALRTYYKSHSEPHPSCSRCKVSDEFDVYARRENYSKFEMSQGPRWLDIRLSNLCNLKCRTCSSDFSSKWIGDNQHLSSAEFIKGSDTVFPPEFSLLEEGLLRPDLDIIEIKGGEPLLALSRFLKESSLVPRVPHLKITTNGTTCTPQILEFFRKFKQVEIKLSVDYIRDDFRSLRGYQIRQIEDFIRSVLALPHVSVEIQTVISAYNLFELSHIVDWHEQLRRQYNEDQFFSLRLDNFLVVPSYLSAHVYDRPILDKIRLRYMDLMAQSKKYAALSSVVDFLDKAERTGHKKYYSKFMAFTQLLDRVRSENFAEVLQREIDLL